MNNTKSSRVGNNLRSYFSTPANLITILFLVILIASVVIPLCTLFVGSFKINGNQEAIYVGGRCWTATLPCTTGGSCW